MPGLGYVSLSMTMSGSLSESRSQNGVFLAFMLWKFMTRTRRLSIVLCWRLLVLRGDEAYMDEPIESLRRKLTLPFETGDVLPSEKSAGGCLSLQCY